MYVHINHGKLLFMNDIMYNYIYVCISCLLESLGVCTVCISSLLRVQVFRDNREAQFGRWQLGEATKHAAGKVTGTVENVMNARVPNLLNGLNSKSFHPHYCYRWAECRPHTYVHGQHIVHCVLCVVLIHIVCEW